MNAVNAVISPVETVRTAQSLPVEPTDLPTLRRLLPVSLIVEQRRRAHLTPLLEQE